MPAADLFFYSAVSFLLGIGFAGLNINSYLILFAGLIISGVFLFWHKKQISLSYSLLFLFLIFSGIFYYHFYLNLKMSNENIPLNQKISFSGIIIDEPQTNENSQILTIGLQKPLSGEIKILTSLSPEYHYGDSLEIKGKIEEPQSRAGSPASFYPEIKISGRHQGFWLKENLLDFKENLISRFRNFLPADSAALLAGLTFGWQGDFPKEFKNQMALSGTTHLVALSGYNIAILVLAVAGVFSYFLSQRPTFWLTTLIIFLFVLMVGAQASVVRAAIMGFLMLLAKELGRLYSFRNALALTALLMIVFDPTILLGNIGFQLSFLSLLGIVYLEPALKNFLKLGEPKSIFNWQESALQTFSAQLAVIPLIIQNFGQFSLTAFFANILILEFVPLTMFLGFLLAGLSFIFSYLGIFIAWLVNILLVYEIWVIKFFADWRLVVANSGLSSTFWLLYYLALIIFAIRFYGQKET